MIPNPSTLYRGGLWIAGIQGLNGRRLLLGEVLVGVGGVDSVLALLPVGGADLTVLVDKLECLDDTDGLLDGTADGEVVDVRGTEDTLGVDEESTAEIDTLLLNENTVSLGDGVAAVGKETDLEVGAEATFLAGGVGPGQVRVLRVGGEEDHLGVDGLELLKSGVEGEDLGGADELKVSAGLEEGMRRSQWRREWHQESQICFR